MSKPNPIYQGTVSGRYAGCWSHSFLCQNRAKHPTNDSKWCGVHDPVHRKVKAAARATKYEAELNRRDVEKQRHRLAEHCADLLANNETEAAREVARERKELKDKP